MLHVCGHSHVTDARGLVDPTRTTRLRRKFEADMVSRFRRIKALIKQAVIDLDVLGLKPDSHAKAFNALAFSRLFKPGNGMADEVPRLRQGEFQFRRAGDKVDSFLAWLRKVQDDLLFSVEHGTSIYASGDNAWQDIYLQSAYKIGIQQAADRLREAGASVDDSWVQNAFNRPIHADRVGLIFTRAYSDLVGITEAMDAKISRVLAQGMAQGDGVMQIARDLLDEVESIGITRARTLARTEVIRAHADASLNSYREAGLEGVTVQAEFATAQDAAVCPECQDLEGEIVSLDDAEGVIPVHPNCRCAWIPVVPDVSDVTLQ